MQGPLGPLRAFAAPTKKGRRIGNSTNQKVWMSTQSQSLNTKSCNSVNPLCEIVAGLQLCLHLRRVHALVFGQVLGILPLEELHAILCIRLTSKVAIGSGILVPH